MKKRRLAEVISHEEVHVKRREKLRTSRVEIGRGTRYSGTGTTCTLEKPLPVWGIFERSKRSGTTASERPLAKLYSFLTSFPQLFTIASLLFSSLRAHRPLPRPPVQDDCEQIQSLPALTPTPFLPFTRVSRHFLDLWTMTISTSCDYAPTLATDRFPDSDVLASCPL